MQHHRLLLAFLCSLSATSASCVDDDTTKQAGGPSNGAASPSGGDDCDGDGDGDGDGDTGDCDCDDDDDDDDDGDDVDNGGSVCLDLDADVSIDIAGSGAYVGLACGLDVAGDFHASLDASASYDCDSGEWSLGGALDADLHVTADNGCSCDAVVVTAVASATVHAAIAADAETCAWACAGHGGDDACVSLCVDAGVSIVADAELAVDAAGTLDLADLDLSDLDARLDFHTVIDASGNVVIEL